MFEGMQKSGPGHHGRENLFSNKYQKVALVIIRIRMQEKMALVSIRA